MIEHRPLAAADYAIGAAIGIPNIPPGLATTYRGCDRYSNIPPGLAKTYYGYCRKRNTAKHLHDMPRLDPGGD